MSVCCRRETCSRLTLPVDIPPTSMSWLASEPAALYSFSGSISASRIPPKAGVVALSPQEHPRLLLAHGASCWVGRGAVVLDTASFSHSSHPTPRPKFVDRLEETPDSFARTTRSHTLPRLCCSSDSLERPTRTLRRTHRSRRTRPPPPRSSTSPPTSLESHSTARSSPRRLTRTGHAPHILRRSTNPAQTCRSSRSARSTSLPLLSPTSTASQGVRVGRINSSWCTSVSATLLERATYNEDSVLRVQSTLTHLRFTRTDAAYVVVAALNSKRFGNKARRDLAVRIDKLRATISDARTLCVFSVSLFRYSSADSYCSSPPATASSASSPSSRGPNRSTTRRASPRTSRSSGCRSSRPGRCSCTTRSSTSVRS